MSEPWGKLRIDVVDDEIIIDLPGTSNSVTHYKPANSPKLSLGISRTKMTTARHSTYPTSLHVLGRQPTTKHASSGGLCNPRRSRRGGLALTRCAFAELLCVPYSKVR